MTTSRQRLVLAALLVASAITFVTAAVADAGGVVENCSDDAALSSVLIGGGTVTFNCGDRHAFATIQLTSTKTISAATTIDGGGKITLSGRGSLRLFYVNPGASLDLRDIALEDGFSDGDGGAVYNAGFLALDYASIDHSTAIGNGGAIATVGAVDITGATLTDNAARNGGALVASGAQARVSISNSFFVDNQADAPKAPEGRGGALLASDGATIAVYSSDLEHNAAIEGGGLANVGAGSSTSLTNSTVNDNEAGAGAGIFNLGGTVSLTIATVSRNRADVTGGGIKNENGTASLVNVTVSGNSAFGGGGLYNYNATANLTNVSVVNNTAFNVGGGISNSSALNPHLNLTNVLVAESPAGGNCYFGKAPDISKLNLSSDATCRFGPGQDSLALAIGPLGTNGGFTETHRLLPGSPAIDAGTLIGCPSIDQRLVARSQGHSCDVGAVEWVACDGPPPAPSVLWPANREKIHDLSPLLDWSGPDCAERFSVVVRERGKRGTIVFTADDVQATEVETSQLVDRRRYVWQVTACNASGCTSSRWSRFKIVEN